MAWTASKVFGAAVLGALDRTNTLDFDADTFKVALFDNTITPDQTVSAANSAFGAGVWASGQVFDGAEWATGGVALTSPDVTQSTSTVKWDATDTASGSSATLAAVFGCLVYDDTATSPADQGICYNYFGGTQSVTDGTFTVVWSVSGIFTISVA